MNAGFLAQHINCRLCYGRASVRLSVLSIDNSNGGRWVYFWAPCSRRRVQQQMRVASCCEPTEEAQHRLAGVAVAVVVIILPSVAEYRDERVCLFVYLSASISRELHVQSYQIIVHVTYGCGWVSVWRRCNTLYTSDFIDDVMFAHMARIRRCEEYYTQSDSTRGNTHLIPRRIVRLTDQGQYQSGGGVCCLRLPCWCCVGKVGKHW